jgi:tetrahydromethanopterin S-methyltransferase subunit A
MANEILDICRNIQDIVSKQPTRDEVLSIVKDEIKGQLENHENGCPARQSHSDVKSRLNNVESKAISAATQIGVLQGRLSGVSAFARNMSPKALIALGTIIGAAIPVAIAIFNAFK